jgi:hypothetical protein
MCERILNNREQEIFCKIASLSSFNQPNNKKVNDENRRTHLQHWWASDLAFGCLRRWSRWGLGAAQ